MRQGMRRSDERERIAGKLLRALEAIEYEELVTGDHVATVHCADLGRLYEREHGSRRLTIRALRRMLIAWRDEEFGGYCVGGRSRQEE